MFFLAVLFSCNSEDERTERSTMDAKDLVISSYNININIFTENVRSLKVKWIPSREQSLIAVRAAFVSYKKKFPSSKSRVDDFLFQIAGVVEGAEKIVHINAIGKISYKELVDNPWVDSDIWKSEYIVVSDGGIEFWRASFNVKNSNIISIVANGKA